MNTSPIKNCRILEYLISGCRRKCSLVASDKGIELFGHVRGPSFDLSDLIGYDHLVLWSARYGADIPEDLRTELRSQIKAQVVGALRGR